MKTLDAQYRIIDSLENAFNPQVMRNEYVASTDSPNTWHEYSRSWVEPRSRWESSRTRSSSRNPEGPIPPVHHLDYLKPYPHARSRYHDNDTTNRTWDRDNRTHVGYSDEDAYVYHDTTQSNPDFKLAPTDVGGFRKLFAEECFRHIDRRRREFGEFRYQATLLEEEVRAAPPASYSLHIFLVAP